MLQIQTLATSFLTHYDSEKKHVLGLLSDVLKTKNALLQALLITWLVLFQQCNGKRMIHHY